MEARIAGAPAFAHVHVSLSPGDAIVTEAGAMASMDADLELKAQMNGGLGGAIAKGWLGGESLFVNVITNRSNREQRFTFSQPTPGEIRQVELDGNELCLQPGAYLASTRDVTLGVAWAGFASGIAREGFFKLVAGGRGTLWYGAYGTLLEQEVDGEYIVDTSHLVAYEPQLRLHVQMAGGLFSSLAGGEGLVTRVEGKGKIVIQTRSLGGLAAWLSPRC